MQGDQRLPHDSGRTVDPNYLANLGILHYNYPNVSDVDAIAYQRNYKNRDEITISPTTMGDVYEEKVKNFFHEHLHEGDDWVRIKLEKHDLMIMPAGIYHRFTTDEQNVSAVGNFC
jgi:1,2-dihydroxy-3-keto-5-methylthiopentene dioxygenase